MKSAIILLSSMLNMCHLRFFQFVVFFVIFVSFGSSFDKKRMTLNSLFSKINNSNNNTIVIENIDLVADTSDAKYFGTFLQNHKRNPLMIINKSIELRNCSVIRSTTFQNDKNLFLLFNNISFKRKLTLQGFSNPYITMVFENCIFDEGIEIWNSKFSQIEFELCTFTGSNKFIENVIPVQFSFNSCKFIPKNNNYSFELMVANGSGIVNGYFSLNGNHFYGTHDKAAIGFNMENIFVGIKNNIFEGAVQMDVHCKQGLEVVNNRFDWFNPGHSHFPIQNTLIPWNQFGENMRAHFDSAGSEKMYDTFGQYVSSENAYRAMRSRLSKFLSLYREQLDNESYNACYVFVKDFETKRLIYEYKIYPTFNKLVDIKMNQFLRFFCDYATNYVKSIVYSIYVLLLFAIIYFIFPSHKDNLQMKNIANFLKKLIRLLKSEKKEMTVPNYVTSFESEILKSKRGLPKLLSFTSSIMLSIFRVKQRFKKTIFEKIQYHPKNWELMSSLEKFKLNIWLGTSLVLFVLWGIFIRALNALALSLNAFITLGYGEVQAKGLARYLAILEGVCGWFLLSIFSVSLISQLIQ
ncbi:MAG: hypothetical protein SFY32_02830 [Bacteroidota bacterium]|nr:hypothetical protein [Bacteroidota bacterium]